MTSTYTAPKTNWASTDAVTNADLNRIEGNTQVLSQQGGAFGVTANTINAYSVSPTPAIAALADGVLVSVKVNAANTGAITLNVNGLGAIAVKKGNGNDIPSGAWKQDAIYTLRYSATANGGAGAFILQGEGGSGTAQPGDVLSSKTFTNDNGDQTGSMPNNGSVVITPSPNVQTIPAGYHDGSGSVPGVNVPAANVLVGTTIAGTAGTMPSKVGSATAITPGTADQVIPQGYFGGVIADGRVVGDADLIASNIKKGVSIFGVTGNKLQYGIGDALPVTSTSLSMFTVIAMPLLSTYSRVIGQDATYLYFSNVNGMNVYRMNKSTKVFDGTWTVQLDGSTKPVGCDTDASGNIYVFGDDAYLYKFDTTKTKIWKTSCGPTGAYFWLVAVRADAVHVISQPGSSPTLYNVTFAGVMTQYAISSAGSNYYLPAITQNYVYCGDFYTGHISKYRLSDGALMKTLFGGANYGSASILYADETTDTIILFNGHVIKRTDGQAEAYNTAVSDSDMSFMRYNPITNKIYHVYGGAISCFDGSTGGQLYKISGYNIGYTQYADCQVTSDGSMYSNLFNNSSNQIVGLITDQITITN